MALIGANGAGKSTTLNIHLRYLSTPQPGRSTIRMKEITEVHRPNRHPRNDPRTRRPEDLRQYPLGRGNLETLGLPNPDKNDKVHPRSD